MKRDIRLYEPHIQDPKNYIYIPWLEDIIDGLKESGEDYKTLENVISVWRFCTKFAQENNNE